MKYTTILLSPPSELFFTNALLLCRDCAFSADNQQKTACGKKKLTLNNLTGNCILKDDCCNLKNFFYIFFIYTFTAGNIMLNSTS